METRAGLPGPMKIWLGTMLLAKFASVFFVKRHVAARWAFGVFAAGHVAIALLELSGAYTIQGGQVSLMHIVLWAPVLVTIYRYRDEIRLPSAYGVWACAILFFCSVSLFFDIRDAAIWIMR